MPPIRPGVTRKYFSDPMGTSVSAHEARIARLVGPCSATAAVRSEMSSTLTSRPAAFWVIQRRLGSAAVQR